MENADEIRQRLINQQNPGSQTPATTMNNVPQYPHQDEPRETVPQHMIERQLLSREIRPVNPYDKFSRHEAKPMPRCARGGCFPAATNVGKQLKKQHNLFQSLNKPFARKRKFRLW